MISTNTRFLKLLEGGQYQMRTGLCSTCGHNQTCLVKNEQAQVCTGYQPVLAFKSMAGTEGEFNTFRLGGAWSKRVTVGQRLGLVDSSYERVGEAIVRAVHCGPRVSMIEEHAAKNHLMLAAKPDNPVEAMTRKLRNLYGPNFLTKAELMTVFDLVRVQE